MSPKVAEFVEGDCMALEFEDVCVDAFVALYSLLHLSREQRGRCCAKCLGQVYGGKHDGAGAGGGCGGMAGCGVVALWKCIEVGMGSGRMRSF